MGGGGNSRPQTVQLPQQQTNTYGWMTPASTAELDRVKATTFNTDPEIDSTYDRAEEDLEGSYQNPLGAYTTTDLREKALRAGKMELAGGRAQAKAAGAHESQMAGFARDTYAADMASPRLVQSGSSGYNTQAVQNQPSGTGSAIASGVGQVASMALLA